MELADFVPAGQSPEEYVLRPGLKLNLYNTTDKDRFVISKQKGVEEFNLHESGSRVKKNELVKRRRIICHEKTYVTRPLSRNRCF